MYLEIILIVLSIQFKINLMTLFFICNRIKLCIYILYSYFCNGPKESEVNLVP
jgi:hypothetical protein